MIGRSVKEQYAAAAKMREPDLLVPLSKSVTSTEEFENRCFYSDAT
eukprot:COSAG02_NODE_872_length_16321_cov_6.491062_13_plen_46_part_00